MQRFIFCVNAHLRNGRDHTEYLAVSYRRSVADRFADSFWIVPGTLDLN